MLGLNVSALLKSPLGTARDVELTDAHPQLGTELPAVAPLEASTRLLRTQEGILVRADFRTTLGLECSRCLSSFAVPVRARFEEEFRPTVNVATGLPVAPTEDAALWIDERHVLDLGEAVRQYLLTTLPLQPICRPDCKGLCPSCGADLNEGSCTCEAEPTGGPFSVLAELLAKGEDEERRIH